MQSNFEFSVESEQVTSVQTQKDEAFKLVYVDAATLEHVGGGEIVVNY